MQITLKPPGKINLGLWVHGRRRDGFHELSTIFQEIPLFDELIISPNDNKKFLCKDFPGEDNLCMKAWKTLEEHCAQDLPADVELIKKIPAEAGLGGASADASYLLRGLNELHQLHLNTKTLKDIAAKFGSDTAFFVEGGCQIATGRGEELTHLETPYRGYLLLAIPSAGCATPAVFKALTPPYSEQKNQTKDLEKALKTGKLSIISEHIHNDLTAAAQSITAELEPFMKQLETQYETTFHLSGSGSSCFALFDTVPEITRGVAGRYMACLDLKNKTCVWEYRP